jgi:signal transduction histidine kinase
VEAGKMELQLTKVRLRNLLENSLVMIKEKAFKHGIKLSYDLNGIPDIITADERKLKQIMYNLLSNAVKFTADGGRVEIKASKYKVDLKNGKSENKAINSRIKISVRDTGIGIDPDDFVSIFNSFEQVDNTASRKYQGSGLGLSLTKKLVELHDGKIWVESEGEGKGATFIFCIPVK